MGERHHMGEDVGKTSTARGWKRRTSYYAGRWCVKGVKNKPSWSVHRCGGTYCGQRTRHMRSKRHVQGQLSGRQWFFRGLTSCMDTGSSTIPYTWHPRSPPNVAA